jgi:two-component system catabolic regulation response regulator CreB
MAERQSILIVEDESMIADTIAYALETEGYRTRWVERGGDALRQIDSEPPDLLILDVGLPDISGFELCREIRKTSNLPIIFLTARDSEIDTVVGLEIGGDDYMTKPFSPRVLTARVRARLRHSESSQAQTHGFVIDTQGYDIALNGRALHLSRYEYRLMELLIRHPGRVYSRAQIIDLLWEEPDNSYDRTVDTHVKTLRQKIRGVDAKADPIKTHRGIGYSFEA